MNRMRKAAGLWLGASMLLFTAVMPARAQDESTPKNEQEQPPKPVKATPLWAIAGDANKDADAAPGAAPGPVDVYGGEIKQAGTGLPLWGTSATPLRWGSFSVGSFEYIGIHDSFSPIGTDTGFGIDLSVLRTSLVYDRYVGKHRFVLQYLPQMAIVDGQVHANAGANNTLSYGMSFSLTPRMSLTVQNGFVQVHSKQLIPEKYLAADAYAGGVVQNNFLDANGSFLADTVAATLNYGFSSRTTLTISPMYRYAKATSDQITYIANGQTYQAVATLGHALTPRRTIGVMESYQLLRERAATLPVFARFNTTGFFYSEQLGRSFWVTGNLGAEHQSYSDQPGAGHWGLSGGATLSESFSSRVGLALAYTRGVMFNNYITNRRSDRVDTSIGVQLSSRLKWDSSVGYFRELGTQPHTNGKYATSGIDLRLIGNLSCFTSFAYSFQNSSTPQLLSGTRRTVVYGLRWQPPQILPH